MRMEPSGAPDARRHERRGRLGRGGPARPRRRATRSWRSRSSCGRTPARTASRAAARRRPSAAPATSRTAWASRTSRSTCASGSGPRSWTRSSTATPPAARRTRACAATARSASTRCSSSPTRSAPPGSPPATTPASPATSTARSSAPPPTRARTRATCSPSSTPLLLDRLSFPLGGLTKDAVRALAREAGLPVADKRESQDLCFVAGLGGRAFLQRHGGPRLRRPGDIVDRGGNGPRPPRGPAQLHGGPATRPGPLILRAAVRTERDAETNRVVVGPKEALATTRVPPGQRHPPPLSRAGARPSGFATTQSR